MEHRSSKIVVHNYILFLFLNLGDLRTIFPGFLHFILHQGWDFDKWFRTFMQQNYCKFSFPSLFDLSKLIRATIPQNILFSDRINTPYIHTVGCQSCIHMVISHWPCIFVVTTWHCKNNLKFNIVSFTFKINRLLTLVK